MKKLLVYLLFSSLLFAKINIETYPEFATNGQAFYIKVTNEDGRKFKTLKVKFNNRHYKSLQNNFQIILPISYWTKKGKYLVTIYGVDEKNQKFNKKFYLNVKQGNYKKEILKVSKKKTSFNKKSLKRIKAERKEAGKVYRQYSKKKYSKKFIYPLNSKITSNYGNQRLFNGKLKSYHSGTDFRARIGKKIKASNSGVVKIAKFRFFAGGSVVIDHGEGIFTVYYHLSKIKIRVGQRVKRGQLLGLSGKSGRVTGPHLHFGVVLRNSSMEALKFIKLMNDFVIAPNKK